LKDLGYDLRVVSGGSEALAMLSSFNPDLLIVDFAMPGMNGAELVTTARTRNRRLKILFLSCFSESEALEIAVGSAPLLRKPFRPDEAERTHQALSHGNKLCVVSHPITLTAAQPGVRAGTAKKCE
jgi:CheY-like chemotaxis protein